MSDSTDRAQLPPRRPDSRRALASVLGRLRLPLRRHHANANVRAQLLVERSGVLQRLVALDRDALAIAELRLGLLAEIEAIDDVLAPPIPLPGRRRPLPDVPDLPPIADRALPVAGAELRELCLGLLARHGQRTLRELHGLLHQHGYVIAHARPVKHLGDMLRYEVLAARAVRTARATYDLAGPGPDPTTSPIPGYDGTIRYTGPSSEAA